jgi:tetratricopeptide (TPR) repeat protein
MLEAMRFTFSILLLPGLLAAAGQAHTPSPEARELVRVALTAQQAGNNQGAIEDFRRALALDPEMLEARIGLGFALAANNQFDEAIEEDARAMAVAPNNSAEQMRARLNLGTAYLRKGDYSLARKELEIVHRAEPHDVTVAVMLGHAYVKLDKEFAAIELLAPLEAGNENNTDLEYVLGFSLLQTGKTDEGLSRMEKVAHATSSANAYVIAGTVRLSRNEFELASSDLETAAKLAPAIPGLYSMLVQVRFALGDEEGELAACEIALRANPRDFNANLYLGNLRLKERDFDNARPLLELALQLQPHAPLARMAVARLNSLTGRYGEAATVLEDLEKETPDWPQPHIELSSLYYKMHRPEDGQRERAIVQDLEAHTQKTAPAVQH